MMKKILNIALITALLFQMTACGSKETPDAAETAPPPGQSSENAENPEQKIPSAEFVLFKTQKDFTPSEFQANVSQPALKPDLSNVENIDKFSFLTDNQRDMLGRYGFVVTPSDHEQFSYLYDENLYKNVPSFITTDSVLQVYHILYDYILRNAEAESFLPAIETLTQNMLDKLLSEYDTLNDETLRRLMVHDIAYFCVPYKLLGGSLPENVPTEAISLMDEELSLIEQKNGSPHKSPVSGSLVLYQNFTIRGHYTRSEDLTKFFLPMMWYGTVPFSFQDILSGDVSDEATLQAMLMVYALFSLPAGDGFDLWQNIYSPTSFLVGDSDDVTPYEFYSVMKDVYKDAFSPEHFADEALLSRFYESMKTLRRPEIVSDVQTAEGTLQFRFMGQRYIPDSEIMQRLSKFPERPFPSALDVAAVLGSARAKTHLDAFENPARQWSAYTEHYEAVKSKFDGLPEGAWRQNAYFGWLWTLKALLAPFGDGYPSFMQSAAWEDKSLATALGSLSELRHDTVLYAKASAAEMGGAFEDIPPGYVEPNVAVYERLNWLVSFTKEDLQNRGMLPETIAENMDRFTEMLDFLIDCSVKELNNEPLDEQAINTIKWYGGFLEGMSVSVATDGEAFKWYEITSETDRNMAVISDVHTSGGMSLEEGVGVANQIFVVVPSGGKLYLTRGAVFDYYEFTADEKLTDEQWQHMLQENNAPARPAWTGTFLETTGEHTEIPSVPYEG